MFVVGSEEWFANPCYKLKVKELMKRTKEMHPDTSFFYTVQKLGEDDKIFEQVNFMTYKGHRKYHWTWEYRGENAENIFEDVGNYYKPHSMQDIELVGDGGPQNISYNQWEEQVVQ